MQMERLLVTTLKMMPMMEGVPIHRVANQLDADGKFVSNELFETSAKTMLDELLRWAGALRAMRERMEE